MLIEKKQVTQKIHDHPTYAVPFSVNEDRNGKNRNN